MNFANSISIHNLLIESYYTSNRTQTHLMGQPPEDTHHALYRLISKHLPHSVILSTHERIETDYLPLKNQCAHPRSIVIVDYDLSSMDIRFRGLDFSGWKVFVDLTPERSPAHALPRVMDKMTRSVFPTRPDKVFIVG